MFSGAVYFRDALCNDTPRRKGKIGGVCYKVDFFVKMHYNYIDVIKKRLIKVTDIKEKCKCRFCGCEDAFIAQDADGEREYIECPICGNYIFPFSSAYLINERYGDAYGKKYDKPKLVSYLYHNKVHDRYAFVGIDSAFEQYRKYNSQSIAFLVAPETVENWYPKTFEEKINYALMSWAKKSKFMGDAVKIEIAELTPLFFLCNATQSEHWRKEIKFVFRYLGNEALSEFPIENEQMNTYMTQLEVRGYTYLTLSAKAWGKVYELQKDKTNNKGAFVAMKFGAETRDLREKIKEGIRGAGYEPRIMDEIEHNHQIVPEMLYEIKNSRFVVAELSHHNNGAYYEAGFAYGLDKEVIHICSEEALKSDLHFDVSQINTIVYKDIDELPEKLKKRIQATIV